jgi:tetratricopeptide (TPR) repeat protein
MEQSDAETNPDVAQSAEERRNANDVISEVQAAIQLTPDDAALHEKLGNALLEHDDADGAVNKFREAIRLGRNDDARLRKALGNALEKAGKIQEAITEYQHAVRLEPEEGRWYWCLSIALKKQGDTDGAIKGYQQAMLLGCDDAWVHDGLADALKAKGDLDAAIAEYTQAAELLPGEAQFRSDLSSAKGDLFVKQGRWKDALAEYHRAGELEHDALEDGRQRLSEEIGKHCSELAKAGKLVEAISECQEVIGLDQSNAEVHILLGNLLVEDKRWKDASAEYRRAEELDGFPDEGREGLSKELEKHCSVLAKEGKLVDGISECREVLGIDPENSDVRVLLGDLHARNGNYEEAFAEYREANRLEGNVEQTLSKIDPHLRLESVIRESCKGLSVRRQLAECEAGLRVDSENYPLEVSRMILSMNVANEQYERGVGLEQLGDLDGAIAQYREALRFSRGHTRARPALCRALVWNGDPIGAFSEFVQAVVKGPWGEILIQYILLLVSTTIIAWSMGLPILSRPNRYLPKLAALPIAVMLFGHFYKRFLRAEERCDKDSPSK